MKYKEIIENDRVIYSAKPIPTGIRTETETGNKKNEDGKLYVLYNTINDYYDLYINGENMVASGTLYLTGDDGLLETPESIIIDGVDTGLNGMLYDFDIISEKCIRVNDFQPLSGGELDAIFVTDSNLYQISNMYDQGYHKLLVELSNSFGALQIISIYSSDKYIEEGDHRDDLDIIDGDTSTYTYFGYNTFTRYVRMNLAEPLEINSLRIYSGNIDSVASWVSIRYREAGQSETNPSFWTEAVPSYELVYTDTQWEDEWRVIDLSEYNIVSDGIAVYFNGFMSEIAMNEIELYSTVLPYIPEPVYPINFIGTEIVPSNMYYITGEDRDPMNLIDGDITSGIKFGYNVYTRDITIQTKYVGYFNKIRIYAKDLPNVSYVTVEFKDKFITPWTKPVDQLTYNTDLGVGKWFEIDLGRIAKAEMVKLSFPGFISEMTLSGYEVIMDAELPEIPIAAFSALEPLSGYIPLTVQFTDESISDIYDYAWDFTNDGSTDSTEANPEFIYTEEGNFDVKLTVSNVMGSNSIIKTNYIDAIAVPIVPASIDLSGANLTGTFDTGDYTQGGFTLSLGERRLYTINITDNTKIDQFLLSPMGDITGRTDWGTSDSFGSGIQGIALSPDGYSLFVSNWNGTNNLKKYSLSIQLDITSIVALVDEVTIPNCPYGVKDFHFKADGTKLWVRERDEAKVREFTLSTPYDIDTLSFVDVIEEIGYAGGLHMSELGDVFINAGASIVANSLLLETNDTIVGTSTVDTTTPSAITADYIWIVESRNILYTSDGRYIYQYDIS